MAFLLLWAGTAAAATVTANISPKVVSVGQAATYSVTVSGDVSGVQEPDLSGIEGAEVASSGSSSSFTSINGRISRKTTYHYTLVPTREGTLRIEGVTVEVGGSRLPLNPVSLQVEPPSSRSRAQQPTARTDPFGRLSPFSRRRQPGLREGDVAIDLSVDRETPFVGEQVIMTFRLERAVDFARRPEYGRPDTTGFTHREVSLTPDEAVTQQVRDGRPWVTEVKKSVLFPVTAGERRIGSASLGFTIDPFSGGQRLHTKPIPMRVRPLPIAGRPDDFSGAVGDFKLTAALDRDTVRAGNAVTLSVKVSGNGNLEAVQEVSLSGIDGFEVYDPETHTDTRYGAKGVTGSRTFRYPLVPYSPGTYQVGAVRLVTFDPQAEKYRVATAGPFTVTVTPANAVSPEAATGGTEMTATDAQVPGRRDTLPWAWGLFAIGIALLAVRVVTRARARARQPDQTVSEAEAAEAVKRALAANLSMDDDSYLAEVDRSFRSYLAVRLGIPEARAEALRVAQELSGFPDEVRDTVSGALERLHQARYAPGGAFSSAAARAELAAPVEAALDALASDPAPQDPGA
ncbi:MAG: BatD family protein [Leptospirillia bacterium]